MAHITDEVLSKETRKLRKKKILWSEDESDKEDDWRPKKEKNSTRLSSRHLSNAAANTNNDNHQDNTSMVVGSSEDGSQYDEDENEDTLLLEPPCTPIPHATANNNNNNNTDSETETASEDEDESELENGIKTLVVSIPYDSMDEYDTDDLLEQLDNLGPLRQKLPMDELTATRQRNQKKKKNGKRGGGKKHTSTQKRRIPKFIQKPPPPPEYNHERTLSLHQNSPDNYWAYHADNSEMIGDVNSTTPLEVIHEVKDQGPVLGMTLSKCGAYLATYCTLGAIKIWDVLDNLRLLTKLRDDCELQIDEFYCGLFQNQYLLAGGKLKDRHRWSVEDEDCHILPCPIKIFDINEGKVVCQLEGHEEEVLCIKSVRFETKNYYVSTSQDGYIIKWQVEDDWKTLIDATRMTDGITCMAFSISFLPNTGNKYFIGACDAHLRLYDFENAQLLQTFEGLYTSYCDCGKFIKWLDEEYYLADEMAAAAANTALASAPAVPPATSSPVLPTAAPATLPATAPAVGRTIEEVSNQDDESAMLDIDIENDDDEVEEASYAFLITRGAEMVDGNMISIPNSCTLHQLVYPTKTGGLFELKEVRRYDHIGYRANSWMVKISTNGRYLFAPTMEGQVFVFNLLTGQVTGILKTHEDVEVRDVILHPFAPLMFSCGDDGVVNVYSYNNLNEYYACKDGEDADDDEGGTETDTCTEDDNKTEDNSQYHSADQDSQNSDQNMYENGDSQVRHHSGDQDVNNGDQDMHDGGGNGGQGTYDIVEHASPSRYEGTSPNGYEGNSPRGYDGDSQGKYDGDQYEYDNGDQEIFRDDNKHDDSDHNAYRFPRSGASLKGFPRKIGDAENGKLKGYGGDSDEGGMMDD